MILEVDKISFKGMDGTPNILFKQKLADPKTGFCIVCSPTGIRFKGTMLGEMSSYQDLQAFAKLMDQVWRERQKLMRWKPDPITAPQEIQ